MYVIGTRNLLPMYIYITRNIFYHRPSHCRHAGAMDMGEATDLPRVAQVPGEDLSHFLLRARPAITRRRLPAPSCARQKY